ncbi:hypothetical protein ACWDRB_09510 [Nonomuraea sp. NPDC003707]
MTNPPHHPPAADRADRLGTASAPGTAGAGSRRAAGEAGAL